MLYSQVYFGRESSVGKKFALHADICNLGSLTRLPDFISFFKCPGTQGQNMRPNVLVIYKEV